MKRVLLALAMVALLLSAVPVAAVSVQPYSAAETCVTLYDDYDGGNNHITWCGPVSAVHDNDLRDNVVSRCRTTAWPGYNNHWSDCASATRVTWLPVNYRVVYYDNINYTGVLACYDDPNVDSGVMRLDSNTGFLIFGNSNDRLSSFRILGGHC